MPVGLGGEKEPSMGQEGKRIRLNVLAHLSLFFPSDPSGFKNYIDQGPDRKIPGAEALALLMPAPV